jgi:hypothetical protein
MYLLDHAHSMSDLLPLMPTPSVKERLTHPTPSSPSSESASTSATSNSTDAPNSQPSSVTSLESPPSPKPTPTHQPRSSNTSRPHQIPIQNPLNKKSLRIRHIYYEQVSCCHPGTCEGAPLIHRFSTRKRLRRRR